MQQKHTLIKKTLEFTIKLAPNTYTNYATMEIVLPIQFVKKSAITTQLDDDVMPVNNFFCRWFTDIDIKRYPDDLRILPTDKTISIYDYAEAQLKYLADKSVAKIRKSFLYSNLPVYLDADTDRRANNNATAAKCSDPNLKWRLNNLHDHTFLKNGYRIPLGLITDLGVCNFPVQTDTRIIITLERNLDKLFEDTEKRDAIPTTDPDASIEFFDRPYIDYQEITLTPTWETYLKEILKDNNAVRMGVLPNPFQQTFEVAAGAQTVSVDFQGASHDINWLEISLVYDKSYADETVYDSYDDDMSGGPLHVLDNQSPCFGQPKHCAAGPTDSPVEKAGGLRERGGPRHLGFGCPKHGGGRPTHQHQPNCGCRAARSAGGPFAVFRM